MLYEVITAYTQTLARPSFREISISQIYDPIQGRRYLGNINLKQTLIHNADVSVITSYSIHYTKLYDFFPHDKNAQTIWKGAALLFPAHCPKLPQ